MWPLGHCGRLRPDDVIMAAEERTEAAAFDPPLWVQRLAAVAAALRDQGATEVRGRRPKRW